MNDIIENYLAPLPDPRPAYKKETMRILDPKKQYIAGDIFMSIHNHMRYRIAWTDLGVPSNDEVKANPMLDTFRKKRVEEIKEFFRQTYGEEFIYEVPPIKGTKYKIRPEGDWAAVLFWVFVRDISMIFTAKLIFTKAVDND